MWRTSDHVQLIPLILLPFQWTPKDVNWCLTLDLILIERTELFPEPVGPIRLKINVWDLWWATIIKMPLRDDGIVWGQILDPDLPCSELGDMVGDGIIYLVQWSLWFRRPSSHICSTVVRCFGCKSTRVLASGRSRNRHLYNEVSSWSPHVFWDPGRWYDNRVFCKS